MHYGEEIKDLEETSDPNLQRQVFNHTLISSHSLNGHVLQSTLKMLSSDKHTSELVNNQLSDEEPTLVDGSLNSKPESTNRPHQVDAVHPFFSGYRSVKYDKATSTDNQVFLCRECQINIELSQEAVNQHFVSRQHTAKESCVYCKAAVYEYFYNDNVYYYHKCATSQQNVILDNNAEENSTERVTNMDIEEVKTA